MSLAAGSLVGSAGCLGTSPPTESARVAGEYQQSEAAQYRTLSLPVPEDELHRGASKNGIPAITEPAFDTDYDGVNTTLDASTRVVGVEHEGEARAYPLKILTFHEIVNDDFGGPLLVTYCPLCASAVVADRTVDGAATVFGVSGLLWHSDLVMYDVETESLWSQVLATAIRGARVGTQLTLRPSTTTTWGRWTDSHPDSLVLLPAPQSTTITGSGAEFYDRNPYVGYDTSPRVGIGQNALVDDRLHPKTQVLGVAHGGVARAYTWYVVRRAGLVTDEVGGLPVVVAALDDGTMSAFVRRVDGEPVSFHRDGSTLVGANSVWDIVTGRAVSGSQDGTTLDRANDHSTMFWFAWAEFYPETEIHREDDARGQPTPEALDYVRRMS